MRNCTRCGAAVSADDQYCEGCGAENSAYVSQDVRSGLEIDSEARDRWKGEDEISRPYFGGGVITDLPRDPLADIPPWRREAGVIAWETAIVFAVWGALERRLEVAGLGAAAFAATLFLGARVFFFLRDGGWLPGARELAKTSVARAALAPITWPIGALTFPFAAIAAAHEFVFGLAPWLFGRLAMTGVVLATAGIAALLASR